MTGFQTCAGCELCDEDIAAETARLDAIVAEEYAEREECERQRRVIEGWLRPSPFEVVGHVVVYHFGRD